MRSLLSPRILIARKFDARTRLVGYKDPRGCPYTFNGFHGSGLIALASTRRPRDEGTHGNESWDYSWRLRHFCLLVVFLNVFDSGRDHLIEYLDVAHSQLPRLYCEIRKLFIARRLSGINSFLDSIENTESARRYSYYTRKNFCND